MASQSDAALSVKLSQFLANKNTQPGDRLALAAFLEARPAYSKPTSYISDIEQRLELLREMRQECEKVDYEIEFTAALWSVLMIVPLEQLRFLRDSPLLALKLDGIISSIPILLKVFLAKNPSQEELLYAHISKKRTRSSMLSQAHSYTSLDELNLNKSSRDKSESQKCEQRDRCCVVTSTANPDICHIFPFAAKKTPDRTSSGLKVLYILWDTQTFQRLNDILVKNGNIIDTASNMVALEPVLHRWWGKAMIGFEPIEKIEKGIRLRFRWLSKTKLAMWDEVAWDLNPLECLQPYSDEDGYVKIAHSKTCRPILDGTVIDITAQDESAVPSWDLFSLQWDLIRMASLCGAAEASDDDDWESDDDNDEAPLAKVARTTNDLYLDSPIMAPVTSGFQPLQSLPLQSLPLQSLPLQSLPLQSLPLQSVPVQSRESSPTKVLHSRESSPTKVLHSRESSPTKALHSRESSPTKVLHSRESSPTKALHSRESSPAKSQARRVDENNLW